MKTTPKYEEEMKTLKKDMNNVKLNKEEISTALAKNPDGFTADEIYKYSRPDSVNINFFYFE